MMESIDERDAPVANPTYAGLPVQGPEAEADLLRRAQALAEELAARPNLGLKAAPEREMERFAELGLLLAPLPARFGGLGLGTEPGTQRTLLRLLSIVGGADLALGRIYEGHVNGVLLVLRYGTEEQIGDLAADVSDGKLSGVWNTGQPELLQLRPHGDAFRYEGGKTFATGAAFVSRPVITAELAGRGWQMTLPRMESLGASIDRSFWHPLGMESSESFGVDLSGGVVSGEQLIGAPGDFYRDPMFRGGAMRFAAVQAGAVLRLHAAFAQWLEQERRRDSPYQIARLGEIAIASQQCVLWVEKAAAVAEACFFSAEPELSERMIECANMTRIAIEKQATSVMQLVTAGVGAHGLLQPHPFERILRDLTMYLRQPAPDQALASIGRASVEKAHKRLGGTAWGFWSGDDLLHSLPASYFDRIYRAKNDPWNFETSGYEHHKYDATLASLPQPRYGSALEVGCSIGVLTERLAAHADRLLGVDVSPDALRRAADRCIAQTHVSFSRMEVPKEFPDDCFDLILISEVAYYWRMADLERAADGLAKRHLPGGHLVLVHLTEFVPDYPLRGDEVHDYWRSRPEWRAIHHERHGRFRLDVLERIEDRLEKRLEA